jgi:nucleoside-diphosphate-sugar epimerase
MNVLLTGAAGFIGRALSVRLEQEGHSLRRVVRGGTKNGGLICVEDIDASTDWTGALEGCTTVVHLAARVHVMRDTARDPLSEFRKVNVEATINLARQAALAGVRRFVFLSTIGVNGYRTDGVAFTEEDKPQPHDDYSISKYEAEQGLIALAKLTGIEVVVIRPPLVYGPGAKGNFATLTKLARTGLPLPLGAVENQRSLLGLENLLSFTALCADYSAAPQAANQVFLVSDGRPVSTAELYRTVAAAYGRKPFFIAVPVGLMRFCAEIIGKPMLANRLLGSLVIDDCKARNVLGWRPPLSMAEQLRRMAAVHPC